MCNGEYQTLLLLLVLTFYFLGLCVCNASGACGTHFGFPSNKLDIIMVEQCVDGVLSVSATSNGSPFCSKASSFLQY